MAKKKDKWRPETWHHDRRQEVRRRIDTVGMLSRKLAEDFHKNSILIDIRYDKLFTLVQELYNDLELDKLAQDQQRRDRRVKQKVKERYG